MGEGEGEFKGRGKGKGEDEGLQWVRVRVIVRVGVRVRARGGEHGDSMLSTRRSPWAACYGLLHTVRPNHRSGEWPGRSSLR